MIRDGMWTGERCFLIGGGPSLRHFDWNRLHGERVIGTNFSCPCPDISVVNDARIIRTKSTRSQWQEMAGEKVFVNRHLCGPEEADFATVLCGVEEWSDSISQGLVIANNCGIPALNLADCLGAGIVYLLGFDMRGEGGRVARSHDCYPEAWNGSDACYINMLRAFGRWSQYVRASVWNLNPDSALECFPKAEWKIGGALPV